MKRRPPDLKFERSFFKNGFQLVAGVDEVGRGCLAGPVVAAACILDMDNIPVGIRDSKELSQKRRNELSTMIKNSSLAYAISTVTSKKIDQIGILPATKLAMRQAITKLLPRPDFILIDAVNISLPNTPQLAILHGDQTSISIAAASIIAKVYRDQLMQKAHQKYPEYAFDKNVGYGTRQHISALHQLGPSPLHRTTFSY
jgi:ribonuclease HII